jgi:hypothetical protein
VRNSSRTLLGSTFVFSIRTIVGLERLPFHSGGTGFSGFARFQAGGEIDRPASGFNGSHPLSDPPPCGRRVLKLDRESGLCPGCRLNLWTATVRWPGVLQGR